MSYEQAQRDYDNQLPDDNYEECPDCKGTGVAAMSDCCSDENVDEDILICPSCKEHCGLMLCDICIGSGRVEKGTSKQRHDEEEADRARDRQIDEEMGL